MLPISWDKCFGAGCHSTLSLDSISFLTMKLCIHCLWIDETWLFVKMERQTHKIPNMCFQTVHKSVKNRVGVNWMNTAESRLWQLLGWEIATDLGWLIAFNKNNVLVARCVAKIVLQWLYPWDAGIISIDVYRTDYYHKFSWLPNSLTNVSEVYAPGYMHELHISSIASHSAY